jgi:protein transport protein SEC31
VASGASDSEIFIWDLTNPKTPMTPGTKVQPADDVSHVAWNKQGILIIILIIQKLKLILFYFLVEHILASTFSTRCVVWDLRKNEPVIKVSDTTSRVF